MESLRREKPLLVVINTTLMHNHQLEVARALEKGRFLYQTEPKHVVEVLRKANWTNPIPVNAASSSSRILAGSSSYQLLQYPAVEREVFRKVLDQNAAVVRRFDLANVLLTILMPAAVAAVMTWRLFA